MATKRVIRALMAGRKADFERNVPIFLSATKRMCKLARDVPNWKQLSTKTPI
jgi:lipid A disaccharide synthetase